MEEESIKKKKKATSRKKKDNRGGAREGAGRPHKDNPRTQHITIIGTPLTLARIKQLRMFMRGQEPSFNTAFEQWIEGLAKDYGIE